MSGIIDFLGDVAIIGIVLFVLGVALVSALGSLRLWWYRRRHGGHS